MIEDTLDLLFNITSPNNNTVKISDLMMALMVLQEDAVTDIEDGYGTDLSVTPTGMGKTLRVDLDITGGSGINITPSPSLAGTVTITNTGVLDVNSSTCPAPSSGPYTGSVDLVAGMGLDSTCSAGSITFSTNAAELVPTLVAEPTWIPTVAPGICGHPTCAPSGGGGSFSLTQSDHHWCQAYIDDPLAVGNDYDFRSTVPVTTVVQGQMVNVRIQMSVPDLPNYSGPTQLGLGSGRMRGNVGSGSDYIALCEGQDDNLPLDSVPFNYCDVANFGPCNCFNTNPAPGHHAPCVFATTGLPSTSFFIVTVMWKIDTVGRWAGGVPFADDYSSLGTPQPSDWIGHASPLEDFFFVFFAGTFLSPGVVRRSPYGLANHPMRIMHGTFWYPLF